MSGRDSDMKLGSTIDMYVDAPGSRLIHNPAYGEGRLNTKPAHLVPIEMIRRAQRVEGFTSEAASRRGK